MFNTCLLSIVWLVVMYIGSLIPPNKFRKAMPLLFVYSFAMGTGQFVFDIPGVFKFIGEESLTVCYNFLKLYNTIRELL